MQDARADATPYEEGREAESPRTAAGWIGAGGLVWAAAALGLVSRLLPDKTPIAKGLEAWWGFAQLLLRDVLIAAAIVALAAAAACVAHRPIVRIERWFWAVSRRRLLAVLCVLGAGLSFWLCYFPIDHSAHWPDEVAMLYQAKNFARGQLYAPALPKPVQPFFEYEYILSKDGKCYGKYFWASSLLLVPGVWLGVPWLMNPLLGGVAVLGFYALGRELFGEKAGRVAALLAALSPFRISMYAIMMSHGGCLLAVMLFTLFLVRAMRDPGRVRHWVLAGVCLGLMMNFRPLTAVAISASVGGASLLIYRLRGVTWKSVVAFGAPLVVFAALFVGYNAALTGDPLLTPFEKWSPMDRLGFGPDLGMQYWPSRDRGHDLPNAMKNTLLNIDAVASNLLGWGRGTLLLMAAALLTRAQRRMQLLGLAGVLSLATAYFFYHFSGVLAGQSRYWSEAMGFMILLAVGGLTALRMGIASGFRRFGWRLCDARARATTCAAVVGLTIWSFAATYPLLASDWGQSVLSWNRPEDLRDALARQPISNAIVFIASAKGPLDDYAIGASLNSPGLDDDVIFARDLSDERRPRRNEIAQAYFPDRKAYRFVAELGQPARFEPLPAVATQPTR